MQPPTVTRRTGVHLDAAQLDRELARRGITAAALARQAHVQPVLLSRARHGQPVLPSTLRKLADALAIIPVLEGIDALILAPDTKKPDAVLAPRIGPVVKEGSRASGDLT